MSSRAKFYNCFFESPVPGARISGRQLEENEMSIIGKTVKPVEGSKGKGGKVCQVGFSQPTYDVAANKETDCGFQLLVLCDDGTFEESWAVNYKIEE